MLYSATVYIFLIAYFSISFANTDLSDARWLNQSKSDEIELARASKYEWTGILENTECPGNVLTLNPGEGTRIQSHKSFGKKAYPDNYRVSVQLLK